MAMLFLNSFSERTRGTGAGARPATEYWSDVISSIKKKCPGFRFIAEAYSDLERELRKQGIDFCYDKKLYDRMEHSNAESVRLHLCADLAYQDRVLRFIEKHDEPRAAALFSPAKQCALALAIATLPGMKLHEGRKVRLPVFLGRRQDEPVDEHLKEFYRVFLEAVDRLVFREGQWDLCEHIGWPDNSSSSFENLVAWTWLKDDERYLIVVKLSERPAQARVRVNKSDSASVRWQPLDRLAITIYECDGDEMRWTGLYVDLGALELSLFPMSARTKLESAAGCAETCSDEIATQETGPVL